MKNNTKLTFNKIVCLLKKLKFANQSFGPKLLRFVFLV
jgi:hypothetical protein